MKQAGPKKCAHVLCSCNASDTYCSQACKDAGSRETDIACPCGHRGCVAHLSFSTPGFDGLADSSQDSLSKFRT
jgi:hypothetical protein